MESCSMKHDRDLDCHYVQLDVHLLDDELEQQTPGKISAKIYFLPPFESLPMPAKTYGDNPQPVTPVSQDQIFAKLRKGITEKQARQPKVIAQSRLHPMASQVDSLLNFNAVFDRENVHNISQASFYVDLNLRVPLRIVAIQLEEQYLTLGGHIERISAGYHHDLERPEPDPDMPEWRRREEEEDNDDPWRLSWTPSWTHRVDFDRPDRAKYSEELLDEDSGTKLRSFWVHAPPSSYQGHSGPTPPQTYRDVHRLEGCNTLRIDLRFSPSEMHKYHSIGAGKIDMFTKPSMVGRVKLPDDKIELVKPWYEQALSSLIDFESLPKLPVEIWQQILAHVPSKLSALLALSGGCKAWREFFGNPVFYTAVDFMPLAVQMNDITKEALAFLNKRCRGVTRHLRMSFVPHLEQETSEIVDELFEQGQMLSFVAHNFATLGIEALESFAEDQLNLELLSLVGCLGLAALGDGYMKIPKLTKLRRIEIGRTTCIPPLLMHKLAKYCRQIEVFSVYRVDWRGAEEFLPSYRRSLFATKRDPDEKDKDFKAESLSDAIRTCLSRMANRPEAGAVKLRAVRFSCQDDFSMFNTMSPEVHNHDILQLSQLMQSCYDTLEEIFLPENFEGGDVLKLCRYGKVSTLGQLCPRLRRLERINIKDKSEDDEDDQMGDSSSNDSSDDGQEYLSKKKRKQASGEKSEPRTKLQPDMYQQVIRALEGLKNLKELAIDNAQKQHPVAFADHVKLLSQLPGLQRFYTWYNGASFSFEDCVELQHRFPNILIEVKENLSSEEARAIYPIPDDMRAFFQKLGIGQFSDDEEDSDAGSASPEDDDDDQGADEEMEALPIQ